jgi:hypothetical protein
MNLDAIKDLTLKEKETIGEVINVIGAATKDNPMTTEIIIGNVNYILFFRGCKYRMTPANLRTIINHLRRESILPIIGSKKGYYISYNVKEIENQVNSLRDRAISILMASTGLSQLIKD